MKKTLITVCLLFTFFVPYANNPVDTKNKRKSDKNPALQTAKTIENKNYIYPVWGFSTDVSAGLSNIANKNLSSELWSSEANLGYTFNVGYFRSFGPWIKVKAGFGFSSYSGSLTGNGDVPAQQYADIDNDIYTEHLTIQNVKNISNQMYLSAPILFEFGNTNMNKIGFYFDLGMKYSYLVTENNSLSGTYSTKGIYDQWGVTLENIPELGFYNQKNIESSDGFKKSNYSVLGGAGITIPLSGVLLFKVGLTGAYGLKDVGNNRPDKPENSPVSDEVYNYRSNYINNALATTAGSKNRFIGIEFGLYIVKLVK